MSLELETFQEKLRTEIFMSSPPISPQDKKKVKIVTVPWAQADQWAALPQVLPPLVLVWFTPLI